MNSYDIFDTLITRWYKDPNSIFYQMEEILKIPDFCNIRKQAEFSLSNPNLEDIYNIICSRLNLSNEQKNEMIKLEIDLEHKMSSPIIENMSTVKDGDILISDMYLNAEVIQSLLLKNGFNKKVNLYVSNGGKHNGWIWDKIPEKKQIELHMGDNHHSDVVSAMQHGINAVHYLGHNFNDKEQIMYRYNKSVSYISRILRLLNPFKINTFANLLWNEASKYTIPINIILSNIIYNNVINKDYKYILFSTRDCHYLYEMFINLYPQFKDKCRIFHTSRKMYYLPTEHYVTYAKQLMNNSLVIDLQGTGNSFKHFCENNNINSELLIAIDTGEQMSNKKSVLNAKQCGLTDKIEKINYAPYGTLVDYTQKDVRLEPEYDTSLLVPYNRVLNEAVKLINNNFKITNENNDQLMLELLKSLETDCTIQRIIQHVDNYPR